MIRNTVGLMFMLTLVGSVLVVTGLMGFQPPAHMTLDPATWTTGTWSDGVLLRQVGVGVGLLIAAGLVMLRINRGRAREA
jgi:hypothetical protein